MSKTDLIKKAINDSNKTKEELLKIAKRFGVSINTVNQYKSAMKKNGELVMSEEEGTKAILGIIDGESISEIKLNKDLAPITNEDAITDITTDDGILNKPKLLEITELKGKVSNYKITKDAVSIQIFGMSNFINVKKTDLKDLINELEELVEVI